MNVLPWNNPELERLLAEKSRLPHALLLSGREGIGKMMFARALAQSLLCESPAASGLACTKCAACHWFDTGAHPDYRQIEPDSLTETTEEQGSDKKSGLYIAIEPIREIPDFIGISSHRGGLKVIVIHPAEALNVNAANALLKSLEEPPPLTVFLLVSHRPNSLLPTIRSRCQHILLPAPGHQAALAWLKAQGSSNPELGLAQTGDSPLTAQKIDTDEYWQLRSAFLKGVASTDFDPLAVAEQVRDTPIAHIVTWLQKWTYDLISMKYLGELRYNPDYHKALAATAGKMDALAAMRFHRNVVRLQRVVNHPLNARLFIEQLLIECAEMVRPAR